MKNKYFFALLKILAFVLPFYFVFYGPMHDNPENTEIKILRKYMLSGFLAYVLIFIIIIYGKSLR